MDLNLVVLSGRLAAPPEVRTFDSGTTLIRYLVTCRSEEPRRRVDVLPVTLWDPAAHLLENDDPPGSPIWVAGAAQRRFWNENEKRRSRLEIVADQVCLRAPEDQSSRG